MTATTREQVASRRVARPRSLAAALALALRRDIEWRYETSTDEGQRERLGRALGAGTEARWPSSRYHDDPCGFAAEVLGLQLTEDQETVLRALIDHMRVAVSSGHKIGKSVLDAVAALWFYATRDEARVIMSSVTARQVDQILWRELRMLHRRSRVPLGGELHELARSGLKSHDFREVVGFTARESEAVAGISGKNLLYILDEASGIGDDIAEAIEGNRAGGARVLMTSNPTRTEGFFFDAFHKLRWSEQNPGGVYCIQVSSENTPNVREGRVVVPGLATREWVEEKRREWGEDSPLFQVRVRGRFVVKEEGRVVSLHTIELAEGRWRDAPCEGVLTIGLDPAGEGGEGDESVFAMRRGLRVLELVAHRGLTEEAHLVHVLNLVREHRLPRERPRVVLDREGPIGTRVFREIRAYLERFDEQGMPFVLFGVRASDRASREPDVWDRQRDALWGNASRWLRAQDEGGLGGAIPEDTRLEAELHAPEWIPGPNGRMKVTPKKDLRKKLGRSPDRADAVCLAVWDPMPHELVVEDEAARPPAKLDPFSGAIDPWGRR